MYKYYMDFSRIAVIGLGFVGGAIVESLSMKGLKVKGYDKFKDGFSGGYYYKSLVSKVNSKCRDIIEEIFTKLNYKREDGTVGEKTSNDKLDSYYEILNEIDPNLPPWHNRFTKAAPGSNVVSGPLTLIIVPEVELFIDALAR